MFLHHAETYCWIVRSDEVKLFIENDQLLQFWKNYFCNKAFMCVKKSQSPYLVLEADCLPMSHCSSNLFLKLLEKVAMHQELCQLARHWNIFPERKRCFLMWNVFHYTVQNRDQRTRTDQFKPNRLRAWTYGPDIMGMVWFLNPWFYARPSQVI